MVKTYVRKNEVQAVVFDGTNEAEVIQLAGADASVIAKDLRDGRQHLIFSVGASVRTIRQGEIIYKQGRSLYIIDEIEFLDSYEIKP